MTHTTSNDAAAGGYQPGELVDVTIRGARVLPEPAGIIPDAGSLHVELGPGWHWIVDTRRAEVTRRAPVEWPPQPADVWRDKDGDAWMVAGDGNGGIEMCMADGGTRGVWRNVDEVLENWSPMRLEYRPGWTPTPPATGEPAEVDEEPIVIIPGHRPGYGNGEQENKRAEFVAGLRALADFVDARIDLPLPYISANQAYPTTAAGSTTAEVREIAGRLGIAPNVDDETTVNVELWFGRWVRYNVYANKPAEPPMPTDEEIAAEIDDLTDDEITAQAEEAALPNLANLADPITVTSPVPAPRESGE